MTKIRDERFPSLLYCLPASLFVAALCSAAFCLATLCFATFVTSAVFAGEQPQWVEVRSPNFSVVTDAGEKRGREVAMRFEQMRAVFGTLVTKANVNLAVPLQIVAFRNTKELRQVAPLFNGKPTQLGGLFQGSTDRSFIMLDMSVENPWEVVFHEYAHQLMNGTLPAGTAPWFEEGFAVYFSSIEVDGKEARVGKISHNDYAILQQLGTMKIADLFRVRQNSSTYNETGDHRTTFYVQSGMLMHYIYDNQLLPKVAVYFDLKENKHLPVEDAIRQAFGMSAGQFDTILSSYIRSGHYKFYAMPPPGSISSNNYTVTPMSDAASKAVLADIHLHSPDYQERGLSEFQDILKSDPKNAAACRGVGYAYLQKRDFTQAAEYFKRASELNSKDPLVHYYNALLMARAGGFGSGSDLPTMTRELETSISLDPGFADSYALLAFAQSASGDPAKGLDTMRRALAISPRNETYLFNLASLYLTNQQVDQAIAVLQSLQATGNPDLASRVAAALTQAQQFRDMVKEGTAVYGGPRVLLRGSENPESQGNSESEAEKPAQPLRKAPTNSGAAKFAVGVLNSVDCSADPSAILTVVSGIRTLKMKVADKSHVVLIGADKFSCSWSKQKVTISYREGDAGEISVISMEIQ